MKVVSTRADLHEARAKLSGSVGLVPTMGALHPGHISLVRAAQSDNDATIVTIFVNPTQFGPNEDLSAYPRTLKDDLDLLEAEGVDIVFAPTPSEVYPPGFQTQVDVTQVSQGLEGERRPGHFQGVATVVTKLFNLAQPTCAYFGQKDAQQVVVVRRLVADLNFPVFVEVIPTVREPDGLAMSSRNRYLDTAQRSSASVLFRALRAASDRYTAGERHPAILRNLIQTTVESEAQAEVDYVSIADPQTLRELSLPGESPVLASLTVKFGKVRLLDNMLFPESLNSRSGLTLALGSV